eukprot:2525448-Amphidinium_carterae.1
MSALVEPLTTYTLSGKVWTLKDWEKSLLTVITRSAVGTLDSRPPSGMDEVEDVSDRGGKKGISEPRDYSSEFLVTPCVMLSSFAPEEAEQSSTQQPPKRAAIDDRTTHECSPSIG